MSGTDGRILVEVAGHVATVTIDRPDRKNAFDDPMIAAFAIALDRLGGSGARAVVVTGAGDAAFCAGYDIGCIDPDQPEELPHPDERFERVVTAVRELPCPVVCAMGGDAFGGGMDLALSCDLLLASPAARMAMTPCRLGLVYSASGLTRFISRVGAHLTRRVFLTGAPIDAAEAHRLGIVDELVEREGLNARAMELALVIARNAPLSVSGIRRAIRASEAAVAMDPAAAARRRSDRLAALRSADLREALAAFAARREPVFRSE